jgi:hypothetical protein
MLSTRRICSLLIILALVLGAANTATYAGGMADTIIVSAGFSMNESECDDCASDEDIVVCVKTACAILVGLLPAMAIMPAAGPSRRSPPRHRSGAGLVLFPDTGPPRTVVLG